MSRFFGMSFPPGEQESKFHDHLASFMAHCYTHTSEQIKRIQWYYLWKYFSLRFDSIGLSESVHQKRRDSLGSMFLAVGDFLLNEIDLSAVGIPTILMLKSALVFLVDDYPDMGENVMYSPLMFQLNDVIESWSTNCPSLRGNYDVTMINEVIEIIPHHSWWKESFENVTMINGIPIEEALAAEEERR